MNNMKDKKVVIIGAGFSGTTAAYLLKKKGFDVTVLESDTHPGGGCWTRYYNSHPYTIGPRIFYTPNQATFDFLNSFVEIRRFDTKTLSYVADDDNFYNYPLQYDDLDKMPDKEVILAELEKVKKGEISVEDFESYWKSAVGETLYNKFVNKYSKKMWGIDSNKQLSANFNWVNKGTPIRDGDTRLFGDQLQGYPYASDGYNGFFTKALDGVNVIYNSNVIAIDRETLTVKTASDEYSADIIINTGHTDEVFGFKHGELDFSGRTLTKVVLPSNQLFDNEYHWVHYSSDEEYTRVTDFKKVTKNNSENCLMLIETPSNEGRLYPKQLESEIKKYEMYKNDFPENYYSIGRLGKFKYTGISDAIDQAFELVENIS
jgi:UDP-galactopyranose mutase